MILRCIIQDDRMITLDCCKARLSRGSQVEIDDKFWLMPEVQGAIKLGFIQAIGTMPSGSDGSIMSPEKTIAYQNTYSIRLAFECVRKSVEPGHIVNIPVSKIDEPEIRNAIMAGWLLDIENPASMPSPGSGTPAILEELTSRDIVGNSQSPVTQNQQPQQYQYRPPMPHFQPQSLPQSPPQSQPQSSHIQPQRQPPMHIPAPQFLTPIQASQQASQQYQPTMPSVAVSEPSPIPQYQQLLRPVQPQSVPMPQYQTPIMPRYQMPGAGMQRPQNPVSQSIARQAAVQQNPQAFLNPLIRSIKSEINGAQIIVPGPAQQRARETLAQRPALPFPVVPRKKRVKGLHAYEGADDLYSKPTQVIDPGIRARPVPQYRDPYAVDIPLLSGERHAAVPLGDVPMGDGLTEEERLLDMIQGRNMMPGGTSSFAAIPLLPGARLAPNPAAAANIGITQSQRRPQMFGFANIFKE